MNDRFTILMKVSIGSQYGGTLNLTEEREIPEAGFEEIARIMKAFHEIFETAMEKKK